MSFHLKNGRFTKSSPKKKTINLKNQGVYDNGSDDITAENCGESSFEEGLSWRDGRRFVKLGVLAETLGKCSGEGCSSKQVSSCKKKRSTSVLCENKGSRSHNTFNIISYWNTEIYGKHIVTTS